MDSTKDFTTFARSLKVEKNQEMISFDVSSLFTNVPLDFTIDLIIKKVYNKKMIKTKLKKEELRELLQICTKELHFTFDGKVYQQIDGVCMGSPLGPVLANVFMVHLEESIVPTIQPTLSVWKRYVDDTFTLVERGKVDEVIERLNNFHPNIKFTHEKEKDKEIAFLDVLLRKKEDGTVDTTVYRKTTDNSIYIHWDSYAPKQWKVGTLFGITRRAYEICSTEDGLVKELGHIKKVFTTINGYPKNLVWNVMKKVKDDQSNSHQETESTSNEETETNATEPTIFTMTVPYAGAKSETMIKDLKNALKRNLPATQEYRIVQTGTKLSCRFNVKDKVNDKHLSNFVYYRKCTNKKCKDDYIGETGRRKVVRNKDHGGHDKQSWIFKHSSSTGHPRAKDDDFVILARNYEDRRKRRIAEAMFIRDIKPSLNKQKESYKLALFA